jgi:hypothetical protein
MTPPVPCEHFGDIAPPPGSYGVLHTGNPGGLRYGSFVTVTGQTGGSFVGKVLSKGRRWVSVYVQRFISLHQLSIFHKDTLDAAAVRELRSAHIKDELYFTSDVVEVAVGSCGMSATVHDEEQWNWMNLQKRDWFAPVNQYVCRKRRGLFLGPSCGK